LTAHRAHFPGELSLGLARRVALARAFAVEPKLLILDEPFASLDAALATRMREELAWLVDRRPVTVLLVTHDVGEAVRLADRLIVLSARTCPCHCRHSDRRRAARAKRGRYCAAERRYCAAHRERRMTLLIFDCDGVLVDSEVIAHQTLLDALAPLGFTMSLQESYGVFAGRSLRDTLAVIERQIGRALPEDLSAAQPRPVVRALPRRAETGRGRQGRHRGAALTPLRRPRHPRPTGCISHSMSAGLAALFGEHVFSATQVAHGKPGARPVPAGGTRHGYRARAMHRDRGLGARDRSRPLRPECT
jgi:energy-coupling factor transporter ATP-binding protein EcfA2